MIHSLRKTMAMIHIYIKGQIKKTVSQALLHLFQMPLICLFFRLEKKIVVSFIFILFIYQNQNINIFIIRINKKGASLVFEEIKK